MEMAIKLGKKGRCFGTLGRSGTFVGVAIFLESNARGGFWNKRVLWCGTEWRFSKIKRQGPLPSWGSGTTFGGSGTGDFLDIF